jgi:histidinol-phosphatase (PHP family)
MKILKFEQKRAPWYSARVRSFSMGECWTLWIDYHTHHARCGHATGQLEEYIQQAIRLGLDEIGLSDHIPLIHVDPATYLPDMAMSKEEFPRYVEECFLLKEKYRSDIRIRVGVEADYIEGWEEEIEKLLQSYSFDYIIGSVHFLGEWDITDFRQLAGWEGKNVYQVWEQYWHTVQKAVSTGFYDIVGHLDVIKRFGYVPLEDVESLEAVTIQHIAESGMAIELNASGLRMPAKEMFPSARILKRCHEAGIPVTLGSDAHQPDRVAQYLDQARQLLWDVGYRELATFDQRRRTLVPFTCASSRP